MRGLSCSLSLAEELIPRVDNEAISKHRIRPNNPYNQMTIKDELGQEISIADLRTSVRRYSSKRERHEALKSNIKLAKYEKPTLACCCRA